MISVTFLKDHYKVLIEKPYQIWGIGSSYVNIKDNGKEVPFQKVKREFLKYNKNSLLNPSKKDILQYIENNNLTYMTEEKVKELWEDIKSFYQGN